MIKVNHKASLIKWPIILNNPVKVLVNVLTDKILSKLFWQL